MKIRNKNGRIHGAFSAFDTPPGPSGSATLRSLAFSFRAQINPLDKYCLVFLLRQNLQVVPAKAGTHTPRLLLGPAFAITRDGGYGSLLSQGRRKRNSDGLLYRSTHPRCLVLCKRRG